MVQAYTWFIRDGRKGMFDMPLDEQAVYRSVLDLIYFNDGDVPDDDKAIAAWVGCDMRVWRRVKAALIARCRIHIHDGVVHDSKCDTRLAKEVASALSRKEKSVLGGIANKARWDQLKGKSKASDSPQDSPGQRAPKIAKPIPSKKEAYFGTTSERLQPSSELIESELKRRPRPPSSLATAHLDSALPRSADTAAELPSEASKPANPEAPLSRIEVGKPEGWDLGPPRKKPAKVDFAALLAEPDDNQEKVA